MSESFDWKKLTEQYLEMHVKFRAALARDGGRDRGCDPEAFSRWQCCQKHRRLLAMEEYLASVGFTLSCGYNLPSASAVVGAVAIHGLLPMPDWKLPAVGDPRWLRSLAVASGVGLPDELIDN